MRHHKGRYYYQIWLADQNRDTTSLGINTGWFLCLSNIENSALKITLHQAALLKESLPNGAVTRLFQWWVHSGHLVTQWCYDISSYTIFHQLDDVRCLRYFKTSRFPSHSVSLFLPHTNSPLRALTTQQLGRSGQKTLPLHPGLPIVRRQAC